MSDPSHPEPELADREVAFFADYYGNQTYNRTGWRLRMERELRSLLGAAGARGLGRVLSVGCGDGRFELMVARHAESVTGIDLSPEAIELARHGAVEAGVDNVEFRCSPVAAFEWGERFDTALCIAFLHHVPEPEVPGLLRRLYEHVVPGGLLYCQDPNVHGVLRKVGRVVLRNDYDRYHTPDERELDPANVESLLRDAGFAEVTTAPIDLTLTPATYVLSDGPGWPLVACAWLDRLWCALPLGRWASGFTAVARKAPS